MLGTGGVVRLGFAHEANSKGSGRDEWYTPPRIFDALGCRFDLDVCSPGEDVVPWIPAARHLTIEDDGLRSRWQGLVWMNPPYGSAAAQWAEKFAKHGNGVALTFARPDTDWFQKYVLRADALLWLAGRLRFISGRGQKEGGAGAGSVLFAYGVRGVEAVVRASGALPSTLHLKSGAK